MTSEKKKKVTVYLVRIDDLIGHAFPIKCKYRNEKDLDKKVTRQFGKGVTYRFEILKEYEE